MRTNLSLQRPIRPSGDANHHFVLAHLLLDRTSGRQAHGGDDPAEGQSTHLTSDTERLVTTVIEDGLHHAVLWAYIDFLESGISFR